MPSEIRTIFLAPFAFSKVCLALLKARAIFAEPQFPKNSAEVIALECGAEVLFLNPLGLPPDYKYIDMIMYNISQLEKGLK